MNDKTTFEEELERHGNLVYTGVGCSMNPLIRQGRDLLEIVRKDPAKRCDKYDVVLYKRGKKYIIHRILEVLPKGYIIAGDNCYVKEYDITDENILGILTAVVRDGKRIDVNDRKYKAYVHLWCDFYPVRAFILRIKAFIRGMVKIMLIKICKVLPIKSFKYVL